MIAAFVIAFLLIIYQWGNGKRVEVKWVMLLCVAAFCARLPGVLSNKVTNIDEAQTLAHALTLIRNPMPWTSVDFTTNGPLNAYVFFLPHWLGFPKDYLVSHWILFALQVVLVVSIFVTIRNWYGRENAVLSLVPLLAFLGFVQHQDFIHQSSETWCIVPISAAIALFSAFSGKVGPQRASHWFWVGFLLGMVPFGKPQGAPPALLAGLLILIWLLANQKDRKRFAGAVWLVLGALTMTLFFACILFFNGAFEDFYNLFIKANLSYAAQHGTESPLIPGFIWGWAKRSEVIVMLWMTLLLVLFAFIRGSAKTSKDNYIGWFLVVVICGGAYAVQRAGRPFDHYLLLFAFPGLFLLFGWGASLLSRYRYRGHFLSVLILIFFSYLVVHNRIVYMSTASDLVSGSMTKIEPSAISRYVNKWATKPDDYITVYGYYNEIYVETQKPSATRTVTVYQHSVILPGLYTSYYYNDLVARQPVVIVDALDVPQDFRQEIFVNRRVHSPENIPQIWQFIQDNYELAETIDRARIYVRKDRWAMGEALSKR